MPVTKRTNEIVAAASTVAAVLNARNYGDAGVIADARALFERIRDQYLRETATAVAKTVSGEDLATFFEDASVADGTVFIVSGSGDTEDEALADAKGSAPAAGDVFQRAGDAVQFVGRQNDVVGLDAALAEVAD